MTLKKIKNTPKGITRRDFIKTTGVAGAAFGANVFPMFSQKAFAAKRDYILIGQPNPFTGALADFGEGARASG